MKSINIMLVLFAILIGVYFNIRVIYRATDIVLPKYKTVIFVHGCFWHGHKGCKYFVVPKTRTEWWVNKINVNIANDVKAMKALKKDG